MVASIQLQKALYASLSESYPVYEVVPKDCDFPFITFGDVTREENYTKTDQKRFDFSLYIHGWTRGGSSIPSKMMEEYILNKVLDLSIDRYLLQSVHLDMSTTVREVDVDGSTIFQSIQEFSFTINEKK